MHESLRNVTLRQLQIFLVAAENESFLHAAEILHLTQPAVSMQMKRLAEMVGTPLFIKNGRNLRLTNAGEALIPYLRQINQTLKEASEELYDIKKSRQGKIRIGMVTTTQYFSPRLMAEFKKLHPEIEVEIAIANRKNIIKKLENNEIDLAIMGRTPKRLQVITEEFYEHPYVIIASPENPLAQEKNIPASRLFDEMILAREPGSGTRIILEQFFASHEMDTPELQEFNSNESIKQAVMANMGVAFISAHTIHLETSTQLLSILDVDGMPNMKSWFVTYLKNRHLSPAASAFKLFIKENASKLMDRIFC